MCPLFEVDYNEYITKNLTFDENPLKEEKVKHPAYILRDVSRVLLLHFNTVASNSG